MSARIRMTVGEAVVRFLDNQYVSFDGKETKFVEGVCALFRHGCVLGIGEALAMSSIALRCIRARTSRAWRMWRCPTPSKITAARLSPACRA